MILLKCKYFPVFGNKKTADAHGLLLATLDHSVPNQLRWTQHKQALMG